MLILRQKFDTIEVFLKIKEMLYFQKIAEMLKEKGLKVARRTVAKYREQKMIPVSRLRRKI